MDNNELISELKKDFDALNPGMRAESLESVVRSIVRTINRLKTEHKETALHLKKIAIDIEKVYTNQRDYSELRNKTENPGLKVKPDFDQSFFESLAILKKELFQTLGEI